MEHTIFLEECGICKECCKSIPVCLCDYRVIKAILSDIIPTEIIKKLRIIQINEEMLNYLAEIWWYFPNQNLLKLMTIEEDGFYYFLTIPRVQGGCPFLSEDEQEGCRFPQIKPFNCAIYPFYQVNGELKISPSCKYAKTKNIMEIKSSVNQIADNFAREFAKNQKHYFKDLKKIQEMYAIPKISYHTF
ncbi:MAG: YkgJ family cysteine cluster protein [Candidatus Lokiarchaeota archaeon]|nr:YkgJ family cysteine cluster protein [Candidatus Lokiarchaeota archaeon]